MSHTDIIAIIVAVLCGVGIWLIRRELARLDKRRKNQRGEQLRKWMNFHGGVK